MIKFSDTWVVFFGLKVFLISVCLSCASPGWAGVVDNIGFIRAPSELLKNKFPVCDAFLDVKWVDKKKGVGYGVFDLYKEGKKSGQMTGLFLINDFSPRDRIELHDFQKSGGLNRLFAAIQKGRISYFPESALPTVKYGKYRAVLQGNNSVAAGYSYSNNSQVVCALYSDNTKVWILEGVHVKNALSDQSIDGAFAVVSKSFPALTLNAFKEMDVFDINRDGVSDYYSYGSFLYSMPSGYHEINKIKFNSEAGTSYYDWGVVGGDKRCAVNSYSGPFLVYFDGAIFLNSQCNLYDLSK